MLFFFDRRKMTKLSRKNRFRTVAPPSTCERLAVLNLRSSWIHHSSYYYYYYYAALLPRRGPHIASHSVCPSVCMSVRLSVRPVIVTERHVAPPSELQWHTCTFRHAHTFRPYGGGTVGGVGTGKCPELPGRVPATTWKFNNPGSPGKWPLIKPERELVCTFEHFGTWMGTCSRR